MEELVLTDIVEVLLVGLGLKLALVPLGSPLALKVTNPVKPPVEVMLMAKLVLPPWITARLAGLAESE